MVLEVELTEPTLFLEFSDGAVERLADSIASALCCTSWGRLLDGGCNATGEPCASNDCGRACPP
jgi:hypothetical protein